MNDFAQDLSAVTDELSALVGVPFIHSNHIQQLRLVARSLATWEMRDRKEAIRKQEVYTLKNSIAELEDVVSKLKDLLPEED